MLEQGSGPILVVLRNFVNNKDAIGEFFLGSENDLQASVVDCRGESATNYWLVDPSDVENETLIKELPCYTDSETLDDISNAINSIRQTMVANTGKIVGEFTMEKREDYDAKQITYVIE